MVKVGIVLSWKCVGPILLFVLCERSWECKKVKEVSERKSYMEVVGLLLKLAEDCFNSFSEPIAMIPRWLKEALVERMCIFQ
jgi:hypothetical protein